MKVQGHRKQYVPFSTLSAIDSLKSESKVVKTSYSTVAERQT